MKAKVHKLVTSKETGKISSVLGNGNILLVTYRIVYRLAHEPKDAAFHIKPTRARFSRSWKDVTCKLCLRQRHPSPKPRKRRKL